MTERIFAIAHLADMAVLCLLILLSVAAVYLIAERFFFLRRISADSKATLRTLEKSLLSRNFAIVEEIAEMESTIEGRAARVSLNHLKLKGQDGLEEIFSAFTQIERPKLERSLGFLATVGSNAPYIGLFGTVLGIMKSFNDLSKATTAGQNTVMAGISAALIATAAGLLVAIPCVLAFNYFQKQVKAVMTNLDSLKDIILVYAKDKGWS